MTDKKPRRRYYRKQVDLFSLIAKIKLWPSCTGVLHGIKSLEIKGEWGEIITHCGHKIVIRNSRRSRAARWLHNKWYSTPCPRCRIPKWKLEKFSLTSFSRHYGSQLQSTSDQDAQRPP